MADNRIILLKDSDIISESMHKINYNFKLLANDADVNEYKWQQYVKAIDRKINGLKNDVDTRDSAIASNLDSIQDLIDSMATKEDIQNQINNAIQNADDELRSFISGVVGQQISSQLGSYATTSLMYEELGNLDYVRSDAFDMFTAKANEKIASASRIVANSKFAEEDGKLVYIDGTTSPYDNINDYWNSLTPQEKATIDPQGKGLSDPDVLEAFMNYCETKFKTVYSELAAIRQYVGPGESGTDIMNAIQGENGEQIVAAIFMKANEEGSNILLTADHVQIDGKKLGLTADDILISSEHRLALKSSEFTITSPNFVINQAGDVWANNAHLEGDIVAHSFQTPSGMTFMNADGVLHASNAVIDGNIKAKEFEAETQVVVDENGVTGNLTKNTLINGESFNIGVRGTLNIDGGSPFVTDNNSLYIKIVNTLPNQGANHNEDFGDYLYGVPVLCMMYDGVEYMLSPASWFNPGATGGDTSNMRFMRRYAATHCKFDKDLALSQSSSVLWSSLSFGDNTSGTVYLFRNDRTYNNKALVTMRLNNSVSTDTVYQFDVLNWGGDGSASQVNTQVTLINGGTKPLLSTTTPTTQVSGKYKANGSYTLGSLLGTEGMKFTGQGGVQTAITEQNRNSMIAYLNNTTYSLGKQLTITDSSIEASNIPHDCGEDNIIKTMLNLLKINPQNANGSPITGYSGIWETNAFNGQSKHNCILGYTPSGNYSYNINENLPFDVTGNFATNQHISAKIYNYTVEYYPVCTISNNGNVHSNGTQQVIVNYTMDLYAKYDQRSFPLRVDYNDSEDYTAGYLDPTTNTWVYNPIDCYIDDFEIKLEFNAVLDLNNMYTKYNPNDDSTTQYVRDRVIAFLQNYDFDEIGIRHHNDFFKYVKLSGHITGTDARREGHSNLYGNITIDIKDRTI